VRAEPDPHGGHRRRLAGRSIVDDLEQRGVNVTTTTRAWWLKRLEDELAGPPGRAT
jgi:hypothetical protein